MEISNYMSAQKRAFSSKLTRLCLKRGMISTPKSNAGIFYSSRWTVAVPQENYGIFLKVDDKH